MIVRLYIFYNGGKTRSAGRTCVGNLARPSYIVIHTIYSVIPGVLRRAPQLASISRRNMWLMPEDGPRVTLKADRDRGFELRASVLSRAVAKDSDTQIRPHRSVRTVSRKLASEDNCIILGPGRRAGHEDRQRQRVRAFRQTFFPVLWPWTLAYKSGRIGQSLTSRAQACPRRPLRRARARPTVRSLWRRTYNQSVLRPPYILPRGLGHILQPLILSILVG